MTSNALAGDLNVNVSQLAFSDGYLFANYHGTGTATYDFEQLTLTRMGSDSSNYIEVDANAGIVHATLIGNRLTGDREPAVLELQRQVVGGHRSRLDRKPAAPGCAVG